MKRTSKPWDSHSGRAHQTQMGVPQKGAADKNDPSTLWQHFPQCHSCSWRKGPERVGSLGGEEVEEKEEAPPRPSCPYLAG